LSWESALSERVAAQLAGGLTARWLTRLTITETPEPKLTGPRNVVDSVLRAIAVASTVVTLFACSDQPKLASPLASSPGTSLAAPMPLPYRACRSLDLALVVGPSGAYQGYASQELSLVNRSSDSCSLAGVPAMVLYLDAGGQMPVASGAFGNAGIDLAPGHTVITLIGTPGSCPGAGTHPQVGSELNVNLPAGDAMSADGAWVNVECGAPTVILFGAV